MPSDLPPTPEVPKFWSATDDQQEITRLRRWLEYIAFGSGDAPWQRLARRALAGHAPPKMIRMKDELGRELLIDPADPWPPPAPGWWEGEIERRKR